MKRQRNTNKWKNKVETHKAKWTKKNKWTTWKIIQIVIATIFLKLEHGMEKMQETKQLIQLQGHRRNKE